MPLNICNFTFGFGGDFVVFAIKKMAVNFIGNFKHDEHVVKENQVSKNRLDINP